jgi:hypothetical protein
LVIRSSGHRVASFLLNTSQQDRKTEGQINQNNTRAVVTTSLSLALLRPHFQPRLYHSRFW